MVRASQDYLRVLTQGYRVYPAEQSLSPLDHHPDPVIAPQVRVFYQEQSDMDSVEIRDEAHPVRWEPVGDPEAGVYISFSEAVTRLVNHWGDDQREWIEKSLTDGKSLRTAFAFYRVGEGIS
jgi:hypothetical protein